VILYLEYCRNNRKPVNLQLTFTTKDNPSLVQWARATPLGDNVINAHTGVHKHTHNWSFLRPKKDTQQEATFEGRTMTKLRTRRARTKSERSQNTTNIANSTISYDFCVIVRVCLCVYFYGCVRTCVRTRV